MQNLVILGASGSIGQSTLKVLRHNPGRWQVLALTAARSVDAMLRDCLEFSPRFAVMVDEGAASELAGRLKAHGSTTRVLSGQAALCDVAAHPDAHSVMAAIVGAAGLAPTMAAVRAGKRIRGHWKLIEIVEKRPGQWQQTNEVTIEIEGEEKPALICEWITMLFV